MFNYLLKLTKHENKSRKLKKIEIWNWYQLPSISLQNYTEYSSPETRNMHKCHTKDLNLNYMICK